MPCSWWSRWTGVIDIHGYVINRARGRFVVSSKYFTFQLWTIPFIAFISYRHILSKFGLLWCNNIQVYIRIYVWLSRKKPSLSASYEQMLLLNKYFSQPTAEMISNMVHHAHTMVWEWSERPQKIHAKRPTMHERTCVKMLQTTPWTRSRSYIILKDIFV